MNSGDGNSEASSGSNEDERPSLRDLVKKVDERRGKRRVGAADGDVAREQPPELERFQRDVFEPDRPIDAFGTDPKTEAIIEVIGDASNLLLVGPLLTSADYDLCTRLSTALPGDPDNLLLVTLTESPDERLTIFQGYLDHLPERTTILNIGDSVRSGSRETMTVGDGGSVTIETIADPTDLMRVGISISKILSEWGETGGETAVCFHSLTALLQFAPDAKTVFRFVHVLRGRLQAAGAHAHFHLDSDAHDQQTIGLFRPLFDQILTFEEDGTLHVDH